MRKNAVDLHDEASAEYDAAFDWYLERSPETLLALTLTGKGTT
jgi:hypothetical protein